jgi:predicted phage terminase large subunit-like protein
METISKPKSINKQHIDQQKARRKSLPSVKGKVATREERTQRTDVDTISLGYDRFLEYLPADTWKFLPHTFASVMSDGLWTPYPYLVMLSHILATVISRGNGRILISLPPRHGKSWFVSQWLPVWFLSMWPNKRVLLSTYEANFAATWGRRARNIVKDKGSRVGLYLAEDATASNNWATTMDGGMVTAGVGGPITGKGCVTGDTEIITTAETMTMEQYFRKYSLEDEVFILSYDEKDKNTVFRKIIARRELISDDIYLLRTKLGKKIHLTGNHPVYIRNKGFVPARDLRQNDEILCNRRRAITYDVVESILLGESQDRKRLVVYDIEVNETHNFFANNLLLKNCHLGLIDDPHKNWQEAQSPTILTNIHEWFDSTFYTRLEPGGSIIAMHTRWAENDLIGYLLREKQNDGWFYIRIPALGENLPAQFDTAGKIIVPAEMDVLGRADGAALCPQRYNVDALNRIKSNMTLQMWNALFQQRPAAVEGSIFKRDKWKYYRIEPHCSFVLQSWDTASKKNWDSAYSVCQTWGVSSVGAVLLDQWRDKVEYPQLRRQAEIQYQKFRPNVVLIEDKDSGQALIQSLQQDTIIPVLGVTPDMDKVTRAQAVSPMQDSGRVFLPDPADANHPENLWVSDFVDNCATFPNAFFKDEIDTMSQALAYIMLMATGGRVMSFERRKTSSLLENFRRLM